MPQQPTPGRESLHDLCRRHYLAADRADYLQEQLDALQVQLAALRALEASSALYLSQGVAKYDANRTMTRTVSDPTPRAAFQHGRDAAELRTEIAILEQQCAQAQCERGRALEAMAPLNILLARLCEQDRAIVRLRYQGIAVARPTAWTVIAEAVGMDVSTVRARHDALKETLPAALAQMCAGQ